MGDSNFSPILTLRPSHCPQSRISNAASPRQVELYELRMLHIIIYSTTARDIIHPRRRLSLHYLCVWIQICEVWSHRMITFVNAFSLRPALQTASSASGFHQCLDPPSPHCHPPLLTSDNLNWLGRCKDKKYNWKFQMIRRKFTFWAHRTEGEPKGEPNTHNKKH